MYTSSEIRPHFIFHNTLPRCKTPEEIGRNPNSRAQNSVIRICNFSGLATSMELPNDILYRIFMMLPARDRTSCTAVCKHWRGIILNTMMEELEVERDLQKKETRLDARTNQWRICISPMIVNDTQLWSWGHALVRKIREKLPYCTRANQDIIHRRNETPFLTPPKCNTKREWPCMPVLSPGHSLQLAVVIKACIHVEIYATPHHILHNINSTAKELKSNDAEKNCYKLEMKPCGKNTLVTWSVQSASQILHDDPTTTIKKMLISMDRMFYGFPKDFFVKKILQCTIRVPRLPQIYRKHFQHSVWIARVRSFNTATCYDEIKSLLMVRVEEFKNEMLTLKDQTLQTDIWLWFSTRTANQICYWMKKNYTPDKIIVYEVKKSLRVFWESMRYQGIICKRLFTIDSAFGWHILLLLLYQAMLLPAKLEEQLPAAFAQFCQGIHAGLFPKVCSIYKVHQWITMASAEFKERLERFLDIIVPNLAALTHKQLVIHVQQNLLKRTV